MFQLIRALRIKLCVVVFRQEEEEVKEVTVRKQEVDQVF